MGVGWLVFLILWLTFVAPGFTLYQNLAVIFVSILIVGAVLGAAWASWGIKYGCRFEKEK
jgi:hypothetical protein